MAILDLDAPSPCSPPRPGTAGLVARSGCDRNYRIAGLGFIYTSPWVVNRTRRPLVSILVSATAQPFTVREGERVLHGPAMLVPPLRWRTLEARQAGLVSVNLTSHHPDFARLAQLPAVEALPWPAYADCAAALRAAVEGRLDGTGVARLFAQVIETTLHALRLPADPCHALGPPLIERLAAEETPTLATLAQALGVSEDRASRLFVRAVGLPFKSHIATRKLRAAWDHLGGTMPLTEVAMLAGFNDLAHMTRTHVEQFGAPPTWLRDPRNVVNLRC